MSQEKSDSEGIPIVIDGYGIKVTLQSHPDDAEERAPQSWSEVRQQLGQHLMRLAVAPTALIATVFESTTRILRGLSRLPNALSQTIAAAHATADENEHRLQRYASTTRKEPVVESNSGESSSRTALALAQIENLLNEYKSKGLDAYILIGPNGQILIALGTAPGSEAEVLEAIKKSKALLEEPTEFSG